MLRVFIDGHTAAATKPKSSSDSFIVRLIEIANNQSVEIVDDIKKSDLILLYPFLSKKIRLKIKLKKELKRDRVFNRFFSKEADVRDIMGYPHKNVLAIAHENLDSRWWGWFRDFIVEYEIPRLTFWPKELDPLGCRFPYWWNYADFPEIDLDDKCYIRYGKKIELEKLVKPLEPHMNGLDKICFLQRHMIFPRNFQISQLESYKPVDIYMAPDNPWPDDKNSLLKKYNYTFCSENSAGYGYETEKLPEVWSSGCIPLGYIKNPMGDFTNALFTNSVIDQTRLTSHPLLTEKPSLVELKKFLKTFF